MLHIGSIYFYQRGRGACHGIEILKFIILVKNAKRDQGSKEWGDSEKEKFFKSIDCVIFLIELISQTKVPILGVPNKHG